MVGFVIVMMSRDPLSLLALMFAPLAAVGPRKVGIRVRRGTF